MRTALVLCKGTGSIDVALEEAGWHVTAVGYPTKVQCNLHRKHTDMGLQAVQTRAFRIHMGLSCVHGIQHSAQQETKESGGWRHIGAQSIGDHKLFQADALVPGKPSNRPAQNEGVHARTTVHRRLLLQMGLSIQESDPIMVQFCLRRPSHVYETLQMRHVWQWKTHQIRRGTLDFTQIQSAIKALHSHRGSAITSAKLRYEAFFHEQKLLRGFLDLT